MGTDAGIKLDGSTDVMFDGSGTTLVMTVMAGTSVGAAVDRVGTLETTEAGLTRFVGLMILVTAVTTGLFDRVPATFETAEIMLVATVTSTADVAGRTLVTVPSS